jgi:predicted  nucleic acid-binding Zn-ribbon protein
MMKKTAELTAAQESLRDDLESLEAYRRDLRETWGETLTRDAYSRIDFSLGQEILEIREQIEDLREQIDSEAN